jgi:hypothetical protein
VSHYNFQLLFFGFFPFHFDERFNGTEKISKKKMNTCTP